VTAENTRSTALFTLPLITCGRRSGSAAHSRCALTKRLQQEGRGTRVEIYPVNQANVPAQHRRDVQQRSIRVRDWATITHAWAAGDADQLDQEWGDIIADIASEYVAYAYVSGIGA